MRSIKYFYSVFSRFKNENNFFYGNVIFLYTFGHNLTPADHRHNVYDKEMCAGVLLNVSNGHRFVRLSIRDYYKDRHNFVRMRLHYCNTLNSLFLHHNGASPIKTVVHHGLRCKNIRTNQLYEFTYALDAKKIPSY